MIDFFDDGMEAPASFFDLAQKGTPGTAPRHQVKAGQVIRDADHPADRLYFIHRGEVRLYQAGPDGLSRLLEILGPGDWIGIAALGRLDFFDKRAVAITLVEYSELPIEQFRAELEARPELALALIQQLACRMHLARSDASRSVFDDSESRVVKTLLDFSRTAAATREDDNVVLRITHEQLAQAIGVARETVSLTLSKLRRDNLLQTGRNRLIFNPAVLAQSAHRRRLPIAV